MSSSQDRPSHETLDDNSENAQHILFRSLCLEIRSVFTHNERQPVPLQNLSSAFEGCVNRSETPTDPLLIEPLQTLYRINQCSLGNQVDTGVTFHDKGTSQESSIDDLLWELSPSSDNEDIASVWHLSFNGSAMHDSENNDICAQAQHTDAELIAPTAITTQWLNDDSESPKTAKINLANSEEIPSVPEDDSGESAPKYSTLDNDKPTEDCDAVVDSNDSNDSNAKLSLLLELSSTANEISEESDADDLEKFYPEVLDFETKKNVAEKGTVHTIVRTIIRAAESGELSHNISKFTESTIDMCTKSLKYKSSNGISHLKENHVNASEAKSSDYSDETKSCWLMSDSVTASKSVYNNSMKTSPFIIVKQEDTVSQTARIRHKIDAKTDVDSSFIEVVKNPIQNEYTKFLSNCKPSSSLTYRKQSPSPIADIPLEKNRKEVLSILERISESEKNNGIAGEQYYKLQLQALKHNRTPSKISQDMRDSNNNNDSIQRLSLHPQAGSSSLSKYTSKTLPSSDKLNLTSVARLNDLENLDDGVIPPSPYQIYLVNRLNALTPRPSSPTSLHCSHQPSSSSFVISDEDNNASQECQSKSLPVSTSPPSVAELFPSPDKSQSTSLLESPSLSLSSSSSSSSSSSVDATAAASYTDSESITHHDCELTTRSFVPTRLLLFMFCLVGGTFHLLLGYSCGHKSNLITLSPWVGQHNASTVINERYHRTVDR